MTVKPVLGFCLLLVLMACREKDAEPEQTGFVIPKGSGVVTDAEKGYAVTIPLFVMDQVLPAGEADFAFGDPAQEAILTISTAPFTKDGQEARYFGTVKQLEQQGASLQFKDFQGDLDRFVLFGFDAQGDVLALVTQFGEDCDGNPLAGTVRNTFDNDRTPIEYHMTNTHRNFPRFDFAANCPN